jgi:hypothetical protein
MDRHLVMASVGIPRDSMLRIDEGAGMLLHVWQGEVWLTQEGSPEDHMLRPGQWFRVDRGGAMLAHAFRSSVVSLSSPTPGISARCISLIHPRGALPAILHRAGGSRAGQAMRRLLSGLFSPRPAQSASAS